MCIRDRNKLCSQYHKCPFVHVFITAIIYLKDSSCEVSTFIRSVSTYVTPLGHNHIIIRRKNIIGASTKGSSCEESTFTDRRSWMSMFSGWPSSSSSAFWLSPQRRTGWSVLSLAGSNQWLVARKDIPRSRMCAGWVSSL